jgi:thiamine-phosphate pyrophosphorylase
MVIVISNPASVKDEALIINKLFDEGLERFHLRKPGSSINETNLLLKQINIHNHHKISLHQHHELGASFGINKIHYTEENRKKLVEKNFLKHKEKEKVFSSSIHNLVEYQTLSPLFDYVFFGPVFNSISKPGYNAVIGDDFRIPVLRNTKIIALGGIDNSKIGRIKEYGFDGIALLGNIWNDPEKAIENFKNTKKEWEK